MLIVISGEIAFRIVGQENGLLFGKPPSECNIRLTDFNYTRAVQNNAESVFIFPITAKLQANVGKTIRSVEANINTTLAHHLSEIIHR